MEAMCTPDGRINFLVVSPQDNPEEVIAIARAFKPRRASRKNQFLLKMPNSNGVHRYTKRRFRIEFERLQNREFSVVVSRPCETAKRPVS